MRALLDLLFPATCAGCGREGDAACADCLRLLRLPARLRRPTPSPPLLPVPYAVADYADAVRAIILHYKEHDQVALSRALAGALATSISAAAAHTGDRSGSDEIVVVPVPSSPAARRRRGFDPVLRMARTATAAMRGGGTTTHVIPLLGHARAVRDSAGLSTSERARNLDGAFAARADARRLVAGRRVIVADDVVTTGATLAEAARALRATGVVATASAVVAATVRSTGLAQKGLHNRR